MSFLIYRPPSSESEEDTKRKVTKKKKETNKKDNRQVMLDFQNLFRNAVCVKKFI